MLGLFPCLGGDSPGGLILHTFDNGRDARSDNPMEPLATGSNEPVISPGNFVRKWFADVMAGMAVRQLSGSDKSIRYGVAAICPATLGLQFVTFFPAVALTAIYGGFRPGMLATAISVILATLFYIPPYGVLSFEFSRATLMSNFAFILDELVVCGAIQAMHSHYHEAHMASERLAENRELLNAIVEGTTDSIFLKDLKGRYLFCNSAFLQTFVKNRDDVVGCDAFSLFPEVQARLIAENDAVVTAKGTVETFDDVVKFAGGIERNYLTTKGPVRDNKGSIMGMFGITRDITDIKRVQEMILTSEARYRSLFDHMQEGLAYCRMIYEESEPCDFTFLEVNASFEQLTGLTTVTGRNVSDVIPGIRASDPSLFSIFGRVAAGARPDKFEFYLQALDMWFSMSVYSPAPEHFIAVFDIITERKLAEARLRESTQRFRTLAVERTMHLRELASELIHAEQRERDRLHEVLHDHVQPFLIAARFALAHRDQSKPSEGWRRIAFEARGHITSAIDTARSLSVELNPPLVRDRGLGEALDWLRHWIHSTHGVSVDLACDPDAEPADAAVRLLCFKAVRELLLNIVKHADTTRVDVKLTLHGRKMLCITVEDSGNGFDPVAARSSVSSSGLANIARRFCMIGGDIEIDSTHGAGTMITLLAPRFEAGAG